MMTDGTKEFQPAVAGKNRRDMQAMKDAGNGGRESPAARSAGAAVRLSGTKPAG